MSTCLVVLYLAISGHNVEDPNKKVVNVDDDGRDNDSQDDNNNSTHCLKQFINP
jgi:hypothetical protein